MATMAQAIRMALHYGEKHLHLSNIFGEDVGPPLGGVFTVTQGLKTSWNTPLDERGIVGTAIGLAMAGKKCVAEIQFSDYIFNSIDLIKQAGMISWVSQGKYQVPMVLMTPVGGGINGSIYHSHSFDSWATRFPGWKIVIPSNPLNSYGLMLSAIEDLNPVMYLIPKALLRIKGTEKIPNEPENEDQLKKQIDAPLENRHRWKPKWPDLKNYKIPIGKAHLVQKGKELTIVSYGRMISVIQKVLKNNPSYSVELIDMLSLYPYDWQTIKQSIQKTKKVLFVNEDTEITNFGEHLAYRTVKELFYQLHTSPRVIAGKNIPGVGLHPDFEDETLPSESRVQKEIQEILAENP